ncbi:MAG: LytTR family DNA-binding domain-containing protein [Oscillospiraceae bacterium]|nr:LytTR family DNA-binding domain-containing protein [Oscillospiraceae bacterium]
MTKINLVLCDDHSADLETLSESANDYINSRGLFGETVCFSSSEEVLRFSESSDNDAVTVYLLDVIMPETNGIELGKKLRERDKSSAVIYISSSREYALDAFSVHAFSYLTKPFSREKLFKELDECLSRMENAPQRLLIKTANGIVGLALSEIIAVEYLNHRLIFHLTNGKKIESVYRKQTFDVQAKGLPETGAFLKISASYLVNYRNIRGIKSDSFIMSDGSQYKITRKYIAARQQYINGEMFGHKNIK